MPFPRFTDKGLAGIDGIPNRSVCLLDVPDVVPAVVFISDGDGCALASQTSEVFETFAFDSIQPHQR